VHLHRGKQPAVHDPRLPTARALLARATFEALPASTSWRTAAPTVQMLGNDKAGNCAFAASLHYVDVITSNAGLPIIPDTASSLQDYSLYTGYNVQTGADDNGTVVQTKNQRWMTDGLMINQRAALDKLDGYAPIEPGDLSTIRKIIAVFGGLELGLALPADFDDVFLAGKPLTDTSCTPGGGGLHDTLLVDFDGTDWFWIMTYDRYIRASPAWVQKYMDEGYALLRRLWLRKNLQSPSGLTMAQLDAHITELGGVLGLGAT
jgi:hypothetical protein